MIFEKGLFEKPANNFSTPVVEMNKIIIHVRIVLVWILFRVSLIKDFISWQLEHKCPLTWCQWVWRDWVHFLDTDRLTQGYKWVLGI